MAAKFPQMRQASLGVTSEPHVGQTFDEDLNSYTTLKCSQKYVGSFIIYQPNQVTLEGEAIIITPGQKDRNQAHPKQKRRYPSLYRRFRDRARLSCH